MSLYSGNIVSDLIDPLTNVQNIKVEFKLNPESGYYNNLRVVNLGAKVAGKNYNRLAGVYGVVRNIYLYDGRRELDSMRDANRYLGFANLLRSNQVNNSQQRKLNLSKVGYIMGDDKIVATRFNADNNGGDMEQTVATSNDGDATRLGYLDLRQALPLLQNMVYLDTSIMKNLRVVIEFERERAVVLTNDANAFNVAEPILIADEIQDEGMKNALAKQNTGAVWNCIEKDIVLIPASLSINADADTRAVEQSVSKKIDGFRNKNVDRVVVMKARQDPERFVAANEVAGYGDLSSLAQHKEKFQVRINGKNLFGGEGITNEAHKAKLLASTFGNVNIAPYDNLECVGSDSPVANSVHKTGVRAIQNNKQNDIVGQSNYIGFAINDKIQDLQITYSRTNVKYTNGTANQPLNAGLRLHVYAEVRKQLTISGGNYVVNYA